MLKEKVQVICCMCFMVFASFDEFHGLFRRSLFHVLDYYFSHQIRVTLYPHGLVTDTVWVDFSRVIKYPAAIFQVYPGLQHVPVGIPTVEHT
jgi:hypothetical protein